MPATTFPKRHSKLGGQKGFGILVRHSKFQSSAICQKWPEFYCCILCLATICKQDKNTWKEKEHVNFFVSYVPLDMGFELCELVKVMEMFEAA